MIGMILADFYAMKKQLTMLGAMGALYLCIGIVSGSEHAMIAFFVLFSVMSVISSFTYNEQCRFDLFANTLPIGRHSIVLGKYMMAVISLGIADILGGICLGISHIMRHGNVSEDIDVLVFVSMIGLFFTSIALLPDLFSTITFLILPLSLTTLHAEVPYIISTPSFKSDLSKISAPVYIVLFIFYFLYKLSCDM